jgi:hypothetical protein
LRRRPGRGLSFTRLRLRRPPRPGLRFTWPLLRRLGLGLRRVGLPGGLRISRLLSPLRLLGRSLLRVHDVTL